MQKFIAIAWLSVLAASAGMARVSAGGDGRETFADWCEKRENLTPEARHTVEVVLEKIGTEDCDRVGEAIAVIFSIVSR